MANPGSRRKSYVRGHARDVEGKRRIRAELLDGAVSVQTHAQAHALRQEEGLKRLERLVSSDELRLLRDEPQQEGDWCGEVAAREQHEPDENALALALAALPSRPERKRARDSAVAGRTLCEYAEEEDGDHMDELESLHEFFGEGEVANETQWVLAARELMHNPACRRQAPEPFQVLNIQVNNYYQGQGQHAGAPPDAAAPPRAALSQIQKRFMTTVSAKKRRVLWLKQSSKQSAASVTSYDGETIGHLARRLVMKLDCSGKGHLPTVVEPLDETGWNEAKARHPAFSQHMDRWIFGVKE